MHRYPRGFARGASLKASGRTRWGLARPRAADFARRVIRRLLVLFLVLAAGTVRAAETPYTYQAQSLNLVGGVLTLTGHIRISGPGLLLTAENGRYERGLATYTLTGNVMLTGGPLRLLADKLTINENTGAFTAENVRAGSYPWYAEGAHAEGKYVRGSDSSISIDNATVTYREPGALTPTGVADRFTVTPGGGIQAQGARVGVGAGLPIRLPKFQRKLSDSLLAQVSLTTGYRQTLGLSLDAGLLLPVSPSLRLGGELGLYTSRGIMAGPIGEYSDPEDPARLDGELRSGYINDHGDKQTDLLGRRVPENRGFISWRHWQRLNEHLTVNAHLNYWKDSEIVRDFKPNQFYPVQEPDTFAEATYTGRNYLATLFTRFQPNDFSTVPERLPELSLDLLPTAVGLGLYEQFHGSAAHLRENPLLAGPALESDRLDAYYSLRRPINRGDWLNVTPVAGGRVTRYDNTHGALRPGGTTRTVGELGFDAALHTSGTFAYRNDTWGINGLRHLLTPTLTYRYMPRADLDAAKIPPIDRRTFATYLPPLGLDLTRNLDDLPSVETLRLGLENTLQTRNTSYGSRDLLTFNAAADFRFHRAAGVRDVSEVHTTLALTPADWLRFDLYQSFVPQTMALRQINTGLTLRDGNVWGLRFTNHYLRADTEQYAVEASRRLSEVLDLQARLSYDARKRRFNEQAYGITQTLGAAWQLVYTVTVYDGPRRESNFGFNLRIRSIGF